MTQGKFFNLVFLVGFTLVLQIGFPADACAQKKPSSILILVHGLDDNPADGCYKKFIEHADANLKSTWVLPFNWHYDAFAKMKRSTVGNRTDMIYGLTDEAWGGVGKLKDLVGQINLHFAGQDIPPVNILSDGQGTLLVLAALQEGMKIDNWVLMNSTIDRDQLVSKNLRKFKKALSSVDGTMINVHEDDPDWDPVSLRYGWGNLSLALNNNKKLVSLELKDEADPWGVPNWLKVQLMEKLAIPLSAVASKPNATLQTFGKRELGKWHSADSNTFNHTFSLVKGMSNGLFFENSRSADFDLKLISGQVDVQVLSKTSAQGLANSKLVKLTASNSSKRISQYLDKDSGGLGGTIELRMLPLKDSVVEVLAKTSRRIEPENLDLANWEYLLNFFPSRTTVENLGDETVVHEIEDGVGDINFDLYEVEIKELPPGQNASQLAKHIRLNFNKFIDTEISRFHFEGENNAKWTSSNPLNTISKIDLYTPAPDSKAKYGSVVASEVTDLTWVFSTIRARDVDGRAHPLAGNRQFGIRKEGGKYFFFTKGVDRPNRLIYSIGNETVAPAVQDLLWKSFQTEVAKYIRKKKGKAVVRPPTVMQYEWQTVRNSKWFKGRSNNAVPNHSVAAYRPPFDAQQAVLSRGGEWKIHPIEDGAGNLHVDFYSLKVTQFPTIRGERLDANSFFSLLRKMLPKLSGDRLFPYLQEDQIAWDSVKFDAAVWYSEVFVDGDPTVATPGIQVATKIDDLTFALSTAQTKSGRFYPKRYFPGKHLLSGNRFVGLKKDQNSYLLYTSGAFRNTTYGPTNYPARNSNAWLKFIKNVEKLINDNEGSAEIATSVEEPLDWDIFYKKNRRFFGTKAKWVSNITSEPPFSEIETNPGHPGVVDFLKSLGINSDFENRRKLFNRRWSAEQYLGTANQNTKLLNYLLRSKNLIRLPFASSDISNCGNFYSNPNVARYLTESFEANAINACIVTGTKVSSDTIRKKLQELYISTKPRNGKTFSATEHKEIHDKAYLAAGCEGDSANIIGWYIVDLGSWPSWSIDLSIQLFGRCTVPPTTSSD